VLEIDGVDLDRRAAGRPEPGHLDLALGKTQVAQRRSDGAGEMRAPLAPIETRPAEHSLPRIFCSHFCYSLTKSPRMTAAGLRLLKPGFIIGESVVEVTCELPSLPFSIGRQRPAGAGRRRVRHVEVLSKPLVVGLYAGHQ
jgi:hypothetical protein